MSRSEPGWRGSVDKFDIERLESFNRASSMRRIVRSGMSVAHCGVDAIGRDCLTPDSGIAAICIFLERLVYVYVRGIVRFRPDSQDISRLSLQAMTYSRLARCSCHTKVHSAKLKLSAFDVLLQNLFRYSSSLIKGSSITA